MATDANTYMEEATELSPRMRDHCDCGCVRLVACDMIEWMSIPAEQVRVWAYQSCTGDIIACRYPSPRAAKGGARRYYLCDAVRPSRAKKPMSRLTPLL
jgi:hypothetical protein